MRFDRKSDWAIKLVSLILTGCVLVLIALVALRAQPAANDLDKQAAYCMEASFGYLQQVSKLIPILRSNRERDQALFNQTGISQADRAQLTGQLKSLDSSIAANETKRERWQSDLDVYMAYLRRRGFLEGAKDISLITSMSAVAGEDQRVVSNLYFSCTKACDPSGASCKQSCENKANNSEPSKRMLSCGNVVNRFK